MSRSVIILISITDLTADIFTVTLFFSLPQFKGWVISEAVFHWSILYHDTYVMDMTRKKTAALCLFVWLFFLIPCVVCCASYYGNLSQTVLASLQGSKYSLNSRLLLLSPFLCILSVYTLKMGVPVQSCIAEWNNGRLFNLIWKRQTYFRSQARFYLLNLMNRWRTHAQMHSPIELMTSCVNCCFNILFKTLYMVKQQGSTMNNFSHMPLDCYIWNW